MCLFYILLIIIVAVFIWLFINNRATEHFNEQSGQLCLDCTEKNFGQCLKCFNCTWIIDRFNNGSCVGGDVHNGPYNNEEHTMAYYGDPWAQKKYDNDHYKCSYGPKQSNRIIGI